MANKAIQKETKLNFENSLQELESIVSSMERGNQAQNNEALGLEESLELFAKGVTLTKQCQEVLKNAEQQVKILTNKNQDPF